MLLERFTVFEIATIVKGKLLNGQLSGLSVNEILVDSRSLFRGEGTAFFAISTRRNDGHRFIGELYEKGVRCFIISNPEFDIKPFPKAVFVLVKSSLQALQEIAAAHREKFNIPVIGITGSNGKTVIKEWLYQLLSTDKRVIRSPKSYNSQIGVPLSVWQLEPEYELAIFEAGISEPMEMQRLQQIIKPTIGIFTNIGEAHSANFIDKRQKITEKLSLFKEAETLIYCTDHKELHEVVITSDLFKNIKFLTWGWEGSNDLQITDVKICDKGKTKIDAVFRNKNISIIIPFIDNASVENATHCWATLLLLEVDQDVIAEKMLSLTPIAMRLELIEGINDCTIINDSYNSDLLSLGIALDFLNQHTNHKDKTVILSDMLQSGQSEFFLYRKIAEMLKQKQIKRLIGIGPTISRQSEQFEMQSEFFLSTDDFLKTFSSIFFHDEGILLKGARVFEFEKIGQALQQKAHETVLEINLNALIHNLNYYRSLIKPTTKIMAMVKAGSYGLGSFEVANALQFHKVDFMAVAYADEGVELRKFGITLPIMVMNPDEESMDSIISYNLEPEIYSIRILNILESAIRRNIISKSKPVKIHIKLDTGMHRLGFCEEDVAELIKRIVANKRLYVQSIFTHLASTDMPEHSDFTRHQIKLFENKSDSIINSIGYPVLRHVLNTAGITTFPDAQFEMVRLGIGLYGISPFEREQAYLENVVVLRSIISQIKFVHKGETVGYNRVGVAKEDMVVAVVPVGYADGLSRRLSNGRGQLMVKHTLVPIVGNVCMDMCMIDVTGLDVKEGEEVIIFNSSKMLNQLAKAMDTIPYEVMSSISKRVKRVYFQE
ncbi:MAG: bifunctional UDP-N-acetylmuramoyl-tripeptide:D-alanyl-D-alanine ligase/alanine racemase [Bacteroidales bacterium]|jgi:alanine racemase|nr:bifunctional UDP-N-acetylmuramoyl-tripeptide:D-alanyl-D-alanine ligase/alanine racemase [Bacteroidales bacterium]MBP7874581.1 bifunctional UDP-N-acetylmuramoyl-tripeptide:D-alanyl-D-alanine ligase/alanine racemase [Bacteroidales bacterium]MCZ2282538.1 bifunctional UDP-N-acetylmuramoyl-tripeptide:D-alanyl-D-alanine ligase/alanine racemase [Bacteroidales bacterium]